MLKSTLFRGDAKLEAAAVSNPAHIVTGARGDHVRKIQLALNQLDNAGLDPDGIYGQNTANAVLAFKKNRGIINRSYQSEADNIVGIMTIAALDDELAAREGSGDGEPLTSRSSGGTCDEDVAPEEKGGGAALNIQPADAKTIALIANSIVTLRVVIKATRFKLSLAQPFVFTGQKLVEPKGPFEAPGRQAVRLLINVFSMDKHANPRPGYENIVRVFANMDVALNRTFETDPLIAPVLFVPNTIKSQETRALAYTAAGGAFMSSKVKLKGLGVAANRIHVCNSLTKEDDLEQIGTLIHELAHYVSGQPLKISHQHGVPRAGDMLKDRTALDKIAPEAKLRSAEHYAFFAMASGLSKLRPPKTD